MPGDWLEDEVVGWRKAGLTVVVSLLEQWEYKALGLEAEHVLCNAHGIEFQKFPIKDRGVPSSKESFKALITMIMTKLSKGRTIEVHCRAGIGRSALVAGCVLGALGITEKDIFPILCNVRGVIVPDTEEQEIWVYEFLRQFIALKVPTKRFLDNKPLK